MARAAKERALAAWMKFKVFQPVEGSTPLMPVVDTRWVVTGEMLDDKKNVKARLVAKGY